VLGRPSWVKSEIEVRFGDGGGLLPDNHYSRGGSRKDLVCEG
jgi:hypothetical protein